MVENTQTQEDGEGGKWIIMQRYSLSADLLSQGTLNDRHVNQVLRSLSVVHALLSEEFDAVYEEQSRDLVKYDLELMPICYFQDTWL